MARFINVFKEKSVVVRKAYDSEYSDWVDENKCKVIIERDDGSLAILPVMDENYLKDFTADEFLKECKDDNIRTIMPYDCPARDGLIKENITEWVCNEGCVSGNSLVEAVCAVVSLFERNNMWKSAYAKCIDVEKIKKELYEE